MTTMEGLPSSHEAINNFNATPTDIEEPSQNGDNLQQWERVTFAVVISIMAVTAVTGNTLVCLTLRKFKMPASAFLINLAISDIVSGGLVMPCCVVTLLQKRWVFGPAMCDIIGFAKSWCILSSTLTLCVIAFDRYLVIKHVASGSGVIYTMTKCQTAVGLLTPWTVSGLTAMFPLVGWGIYKWVPIKPVCTVDWLYSPSYTLCSFILYAFVAYILIICFYLGIAREVHRKTNHVRTAGALSHQPPQNTSNRGIVDTTVYNRGPPAKTNNGRALISRMELGVLKTMMVVVFVFTVMFIPYVVMHLISLRQNQEFSLRAETITTTLLFLGSCLNPLIYSGRNLKFRQALKKTAKGLFKC